MKTLFLLTRAGRKGLEKAPLHVKQKFLDWTESVQAFGLHKTGMTPGFHDEPLSGQRKGQRSVRLSKQWRVIYTAKAGEPIVVTVLEVNAHDYRTK